MVELQSATRRLLRRTTATALGLTILIGSFAPETAWARHHAHRGRAMLAHRVFGRVHPMHVRPGSYTPPFSAYAVDGNSGRVLYGRDENALRHPASITKVMTLYLLFDQLEKGRLSLDTRLEVSQHAASMAPTKLGLRPGSTIRVEDAILSVVTKSANDMAVAIAERIGGDEEGFARLMTRKAHALGMSRTNFVNASGLPDDMQLTTARDLVTLGRAIHDHFPRYFRFFSTPSFRYAGQYMANHNHLMEQVEGMDGIKTGYTRMSGFNLLSSVNRNGHWMVSAVIGGKTRLGRDRIMGDLIASQIDKCATTRTTPMIAENPALEHVAEAIPVIQHEGDSAPNVEGVDDDTVDHKPAATPARSRPGHCPQRSAERCRKRRGRAGTATGHPPRGGEGSADQGRRAGDAEAAPGLRQRRAAPDRARHDRHRLDPPASGPSRRLDLALPGRGHRDPPRLSSTRRAVSAPMPLANGRKTMPSRSSSPASIRTCRCLPGARKAPMAGWCRSARRIRSPRPTT